MPLPLTVSCFSKIQIGFTFLVPAHLGSPGQRAVKWVCVCVLYILFACLYHMLPHLSFFLHFFFTDLLFYTSFCLRIDPLRFQAGCRKRRLNLVLVFLYLFCVVVHFFWLVNACFCCVRFSFISDRAKIYLGEMSPKGPILCRLGRKTTIQSIVADHLQMTAQDTALQPLIWSLTVLLLFLSCVTLSLVLFSAVIKCSWSFFLTPRHYKIIFVL